MTDDSTLTGDGLKATVTQAGRLVRQPVGDSTATLRRASELTAAGR
jgi:hypothetical protein